MFIPELWKPCLRLVCYAASGVLLCRWVFLMIKSTLCVGSSDLGFETLGLRESECKLAFPDHCRREQRKFAPRLMQTYSNKSQVWGSCQNISTAIAVQPCKRALDEQELFSEWMSDVGDPNLPFSFTLLCVSPPPLLSHCQVFCCSSQTPSARPRLYVTTQHNNWIVGPSCSSLLGELI